MPLPLASPGTACCFLPLTRQRPCACISKVRSRMPETFSFAVCIASFQSPEIRPQPWSDYVVPQRGCHQFWYIPWPLNYECTFEGNYECFPQSKKAPLTLWSLPWLAFLWISGKELPVRSSLFQPFPKSLPNQFRRLGDQLCPFCDLK